MRRWSAWAATAAGPLLGAVAWAAWAWWTAPPRAAEAELQRAARWAPPQADGLLVVAQPRRLARWAGQRRAGGLLALGAAALAPGRWEALQPIAPSLLRTASGPLVAWWGQAGTGVAAEVAAAHVAGLRHVAGWGGLGWREEAQPGGKVRVWAFVGAPPAPGPGEVAAPLPEGTSSALAYLNGRWWRARLGRRTLAARSGVPPPLPQCGADSVVVSADLSRLPLPGGNLPATGGAVLLTAQGGWGLRLGPGWEVTAPGPLLRALGGQGGGAAAAPRELAMPWGAVLVAGEGGLTVASGREVLPRLPAAAAGGHWGCLYPSQLGPALGRLAEFSRALPGLRVPAALPALLEGQGPQARWAWRLEPHGGRVEVRW